MIAARGFGASAFGVAGAVAESLGVPAAAYPGRVATSSDLIVAVDRQATTLLLQLNAGDITMTVLDASKIAAFSLLSIDNEIVKTTGPPTGNVVPISRGFDGTAAAIHLSGADVMGLIDAYHHNTLAAEIQAIETALGANLANIGISAPVDLVSTSYNFLPQSPGGTLAPGNQVIMLNPVPKGVNGTDAHHFLYISGGTGTAEAVLITGGTAVAGAASGTVIVTCANTHSGAWTIKSATVGIQEAVQTIQTAGTGGRVVIPAGGYALTAGVWVSGNGIQIYGRGMQNGTSLFFTAPNVIAFSFNAASGNGNGIFDLQIIDSSGSGTTSWGIQAVNQSVFSAERISINNTANGLFVDSNVVSTFRDIKITEHTVDGIVIRGLVDDIELFDNVSVLGGSASMTGLRILQAGSIIFVACNFVGAKYGAVVGASALPTFSIDFVNCYFDHNVTTGVYMSPGVGGSITRIRFVQCWMASSTIGFQIDTSNGIPNDILLDQCMIADNTSGGIILGDGALNVKIRGCDIFKNGAAAGIAVGNLADGITITDNTIGNDPSWGGNTQAYGIFFSANVSRLVMNGNTFKNNSTLPISAVPILTNSAIGPNAGIDDVAQAVASAASVALSWNPVVKISGTTPITTITGGWAGRTITLIFTNAAPGGVGTGGNIGRTLPAAQNQAVRLTFDGVNWY